ncbi:MAG: tetratricopeptide repeat protein [Verrucomicrobia bacterium]|jgi:hypothetical protein|nr:tetratricopeptide repeat protein [Verrucomicrobiota bacterium]
MSVDVVPLYQELEQAPEDWSIRLRLIKAAVALGNLDEARRLVRTSPDEDRYLPAELQDRIHALLTSGPFQTDRGRFLPRAGDAP